MTLNKWIKTLARLSIAAAIVAVIAGFSIASSRQKIITKAVDHVCQLGDLSKCIQLSASLSRHNQPAMALRAASHACARGDVDSCWNVGMSLHAAGKVAEGHRYLTKVCELGHPERCNSQAKLHRLDGNEKLALYAFESGCSNGDENSCREAGLSAGTLGDSSRALRSFHRLCFTHNKRNACGRLSYILWSLQNPHGAKEAALHTCRGRTEASCLVLSPAAILQNEPLSVVANRRLNLIENYLTDFFNALESVRRNGNFAGLDPATSLQLYSTRVSPALQRARVEIASATLASHLSSTDVTKGELVKSYERLLLLSSNAVQQDTLFLQTGQPRHFSVAQATFREVNEERERAKALLRQSARSIASF